MCPGSMVTPKTEWNGIPSRTRRWRQCPNRPIIIIAVVGLLGPGVNPQRQREGRRETVETVV